MTDNAISIKPHHFIDILTAFGEGQTAFQPHPYGHAVHSIAEAVLADDAVLLIMETGADSICEPCSHNIDGICDDTIDTSFRPEAPSSKGEWNLIIDKRWCERLQIENGCSFTARHFTERIKEYMGDITDIYREIPAERTAVRAENLKKGIAFYLTRES